MASTDPVTSRIEKRSRKPLSDLEISFLKENYPTRGKMWCCEQLGIKECRVRAAAARLGLRIDKNSEFFKATVAKRSKTITGRKRPDQSELMKKMHKDGRLKKTEQQIRLISERLVKWTKENTTPEIRAARAREWHKNNPHPKGMLGKTHSDEIKSQQSRRSRAMWEHMTREQKKAMADKRRETNLKKYGSAAPGFKVSPQNVYSRTKKGKRADLGNGFFRSGWEANYARYLNFLLGNGDIKGWKYEPETFIFPNQTRGVVSYTPDFVVVENTGEIFYHEVKGWMDAKSKAKLRKMKKYHPHIKIILIQEKEYKEISRKFSGLIKYWEGKK